MIEDEQTNIFESFTSEDLNRMRKYIIDNILYTDMSKHVQFMNEIKSLPNKEDYDPTNKYKPDIMKALVHAADIGNPSRPFEICKQWTMKVLAEFFAQVTYMSV